MPSLSMKYPHLVYNNLKWKFPRLGTSCSLEVNKIKTQFQLVFQTHPNMVKTPNLAKLSFTYYKFTCLDYIKVFESKSNICWVLLGH
jgi:hypothetical protein